LLGNSSGNQMTAYQYNALFNNTASTPAAGTSYTESI
jgi:hypothetical protein